MHLEYHNQLIDCLKNTQFTRNAYLDKRIFLEEGMEEIIECFMSAKQNQKQVFFIGNGGSAGIAGHMTADFIKNGGMRVQSLYQVALVTCIGNDYGYEHIFSKPLELLAQKEDILVAISSSGNSKNIINAIEVVRNVGGKVITLSGFNENNSIRKLGDYNIYIPINHYGIVESIHNLLLQQVVDTILERDGAGLSS